MPVYKNTEIETEKRIIFEELAIPTQTSFYLYLGKAKLWETYFFRYSQLLEKSFTVFKQKNKKIA